MYFGCPFDWMKIGTSRPFLRQAMTMSVCRFDNDDDDDDDEREDKMEEEMEAAGKEEGLTSHSSTFFPPMLTDFRMK